MALPAATQNSACRVFPTTHWSLVRRADVEDDGAARAALAELCRAYWYPLYAFVRRRGFSPHDAQDFTQGFFLELTEGGMLSRADAGMGRFRSYLLGALTNFLANERRRQQAVKRGGRAKIIAIDEAQSEGRYALEPINAITPETQFERSWAFALLERVGSRLAADYENAGRAELFSRLQPYLAGKSGMAGYESLARELAMSAGAVGVAIHRMRRRFGELLRQEIAQTVTTPEEVEAEIAYLLQVVARG
jgi:RNA polymerase sigma-70 factor (ECF subfamily)